MATTIVLDAGHGGYDQGATYMGRKEKDDTLALTMALGDILQDAGFRVLYTRDSDIYQTPLRKAQIANESNADYFISIHRNAASYPNQYNGVQTLIFNPGGIKQEMAENINDELEDVGFKNIDVSIRPDLAVLRRTKMPALLVEAGFIDSDKDNTIFDQKFQEIAQAIADGIIETIGMPKQNERAVFSPNASAENAQNMENVRAYTENDNRMGVNNNAMDENNTENYGVLVYGFQKRQEATKFMQDTMEKGYQAMMVK